MPLEPHEELKLAWELELMSTTIDKNRLDIEKIRQEIDLDRKRFKTQLAGMVIGGLGVVVAAFAAGATWWNYLRPTH
jgi:hypothetical protein